MMIPGVFSCRREGRTLQPPRRVSTYPNSSVKAALRRFFPLQGKESQQMLLRIFFVPLFLFLLLDCHTYKTYRILHLLAKMPHVLNILPGI